MMIGVKGKQLCAGNPNADKRRTDGQTDMVIPVYPPNFVAGGIINHTSGPSLGSITYEKCLYTDLDRANTMYADGHVNDVTVLFARK